jgi:hypothetical protein
MAKFSPPGELNDTTPDTPVFVRHLYDRALLNRAALKAMGYTKAIPAPAGGEIVRDGNGNPTGMLIAKPNAMILYSTLAKGPKLPLELQIHSTWWCYHKDYFRVAEEEIDDSGCR